MKYTLDTNCLYDLFEPETRDNAPFVKQIIHAYRQGKIDVALIAISASELQSGKTYLKNLDEFNERRAKVGLEDLDLIMPICRFDISFCEFCLMPSEDDMERERYLFDILFPNNTYDWSQLSTDLCIDIESKDSREYHDWRNKILDVQAIWAHENAKRDVFVTGDKNFKRLSRHLDFEHLIIRTPKEAAEMIDGNSQL